MLEEVLGFERKLKVLAKDLQRVTLCHFPSLREFQQGGNVITVFAICNHYNATIIWETIL